MEPNCAVVHANLENSTGVVDVEIGNIMARQWLLPQVTLRLVN